MGPEADYSVRNFIGIVQSNPELAKKVVRARHLGTQMLGGASGKSIHPVTAAPGGFSKPLMEKEREKLLPPWRMKSLTSQSLPSALLRRTYSLSISILLRQ